jgi:hypothetical protein
MNVFPDKLELEEAGVKNGRTIFRLTAPFRYVSSLGEIKVPAGFVTDGASIPRVFWNIFDPYGPYLKAAVVHDYLYSPLNDDYYRGEADCIFKEAMYNMGIGWPTRETIYRAVRLFGRSSFKAQIPNF